MTVRARRIAVLLLVSLVAACARPAAVTEPVGGGVDLGASLLRQVRGDVEVSVAVPDRDQIRALFGLPLDEAGVQPIWLRIRNSESEDLWLVPVGTDPEYFSAHEVAWRFHGGLPDEARASIDHRLVRMQMHTHVPPGETVAGFLFVHRSEGIVPVNVDLVSDGRLRSFDFLVPSEGYEPDFRHADLDTLYEPHEVVHLESEQALREWLVSLPCCARGEAGEHDADPLNFVIIGDRRAVLSAFVRRGWNVTEATSTESVARLIKAYLSGERYRHAPVSPLYLFGRRHDVALQKARRTVHARNHLRIWLAPARFRGDSIMVGQVSRDVGIRFTGRLSPPTTHVIDPVVDEARYYLMQDLALSQHVVKAGFVEGARRAPRYDPASNLLGDPYYSDGLRAVLVMGEEPTPLPAIEMLDWARPGPFFVSPAEE